MIIPVNQGLGSAYTFPKMVSSDWTIGTTHRGFGKETVGFTVGFVIEAS